MFHLRTKCGQEVLFLNSLGVVMQKWVSALLLFKLNEKQKDSETGASLVAQW